jgi:hypothetical protein
MRRKPEIIVFIFVYTLLSPQVYDRAHKHKGYFTDDAFQTREWISHLHWKSLMCAGCIIKFRAMSTQLTHFSIGLLSVVTTIHNANSEALFHTSQAHVTGNRTSTKFTRIFMCAGVIKGIWITFLWWQNWENNKDESVITCLQLTQKNTLLFP